MTKEKSKDKKETNTRLCLYLGESAVNKVRKIAEQTERSISFVIRKAIEQLKEPNE